MGSNRLGGLLIAPRPRGDDDLPFTAQLCFIAIDYQPAILPDNANRIVFARFQLAWLEDQDREGAE